MIFLSFGVALYVAILGVLIAISLRYFVPRDDWRFASLLLLTVFPLHFLVLWVFNATTPFVPSEADAFLYYDNSMRVFQSLGDFFDIQATHDSLAGFDGTTFTHILTIINQFVGDSLLLRKLMSVAALWVMAFAWYSIA